YFQIFRQICWSYLWYYYPKEKTIPNKTLTKDSFAICDSEVPEAIKNQLGINIAYATSKLFYY
ncbi:MAG TPA: hypothetical protein VFI73_12280, partial [Candidatus Nitrosopolaris sp.]|nr:hypothetical protein [Candidatus Nitrosopolaris sp.]